MLAWRNPSFWQDEETRGWDWSGIFPGNDVCVDTEINSVSWQQMDCAVSYCLKMAWSSMMLYRVERLCLFLFSLREWVSSTLLMCAYRTLLPKMHNALFFSYFCVCVFCLLHFLFLFFLIIYFFSVQLWRTWTLDTFWATDCFCTKQHLCMHVVVRAIMWPQNSLFVMVHVCHHFCRALFPITSISICRITNKCVYNLCVCVTGVLHNELFFYTTMHK